MAASAGVLRKHWLGYLLLPPELGSPSREEEGYYNDNPNTSPQNNAEALSDCVF